MALGGKNLILGKPSGLSASGEKFDGLWTPTRLCRQFLAFQSLLLPSHGLGRLCVLSLILKMSIMLDWGPPDQGDQVSPKLITTTMVLLVGALLSVEQGR